VECTAATEEINYRVAFYMLPYVVPILGLSQFRRLRHLVPFSIVANTCFLLVVSLVFYYIFRTEMPPLNSRHGVGEVSDFPHFISIVIFFAEDIGMVISIYYIIIILFNSYRILLSF